MGLALCFACNAISFGAVLISLATMRAADLYPARRVERKRRQVRQGLRYVRSAPELFIPLLMITVVGTLSWEFQVTLPLMATKVFHGGSAAYGTMASVMGVGAVIGGLISAARPRPRSRVLCLAAIGWGIAILADAVAPDLPLELAAMIFVGYGSITFNSLVPGRRRRGRPAVRRPGPPRHAPHGVPPRRAPAAVSEPPEAEPPAAEPEPATANLP